MVAYVFTETELKFLCAKLCVRGLPVHQIKNTVLTEAEGAQAVESLVLKEFISLNGKDIIINSGIAFLIRSMENPLRLLIGDEKRKFTAYICEKLSILLINDMNSPKLILYPFENESELIKRLYQEEIYSWRDMRLR